MKFALLSVLAMLGSAVAAPISLNKRSLPRLGGVNIAVSSREPGGQRERARSHSETTALTSRDASLASTSGVGQAPGSLSYHT